MKERERVGAEIKRAVVEVRISEAGQKLKAGD